MIFRVLGMVWYGLAWNAAPNNYVNWKEKNTMTERTLRRKAAKIGWRVTKGFQHCGGGVFHDQNGDCFTGYMVLDESTSLVLYGTSAAFDNCLTLSDVEDTLKEMYQNLNLYW